MIIVNTFHLLFLICVCCVNTAMAQHADAFRVTSLDLSSNIVAVAEGADGVARLTSDGNVVFQSSATTAWITRRGRIRNAMSMAAAADGSVAVLTADRSIIVFRRLAPSQWSRDTVSFNGRAISWLGDTLFCFNVDGRVTPLLPDNQFGPSVTRLVDFDGNLYRVNEVRSHSRTLYGLAENGYLVRVVPNLRAFLPRIPLIESPSWDLALSEDATYEAYRAVEEEGSEAVWSFNRFTGVIRKVFAYPTTSRQETGLALTNDGTLFMVRGNILLRIYNEAVDTVAVITYDTRVVPRYHLVVDTGAKVLSVFGPNHTILRVSYVVTPTAVIHVSSFAPSRSRSVVAAHDVGSSIVVPYRDSTLSRLVKNELVLRPLTVLDSCSPLGAIQSSVQYGRKVFLDNPVARNEMSVLTGESDVFECVQQRVWSYSSRFVRHDGSYICGIERSHLPRLLVACDTNGIITDTLYTVPKGMSWVAPFHERGDTVWTFAKRVWYEDFDNPDTIYFRVSTPLLVMKFVNWVLTDTISMTDYNGAGLFFDDSSSNSVTLMLSSRRRERQSTVRYAQLDLTNLRLRFLSEYSSRATLSWAKTSRGFIGSTDVGLHTYVNGDTSTTTYLYDDTRLHDFVLARSILVDDSTLFVFAGQGTLYPLVLNLSDVPWSAGPTTYALAENDLPLHAGYAQLFIHRVSPVPASNKVGLTLYVAPWLLGRRATIQLVAIDGTVVRKDDVLLDASGEFQHSLDISDLASGTYVAVLQHGPLRDTKTILIYR